jgi:bacterioferritin-associated ferredoxin
MFVCNCTGINEKQLEKLIDEDGARTVGQVFKAHGKRAQCGQCAAEIRDIIKDGPKAGKTAVDGLAKWREARMSSRKPSNTNAPPKHAPRSATPETRHDEPPISRRAAL